MRLLFNYLPYSMKEADSVVRSPKKAGTKATTDGSCNNTKITRFFNKLYNSTCNNTAPTNSDNLNKNGSLKKRTSKSTSGSDKPAEKRGRKKKTVAESNATQESSNTLINGTKRKKSTSSSQVSTASSSSLASSSSMSIGKSSTSNPSKRSPKKDRKGKKGNNKISPKLRPRRRASQTYFFKYQLARNPLRAEEEDLKLALLASLQQDDAELAKQHKQQLKRQQLIYEHHLQNNHNKQPKKAVKGNKNQQSSKQQKHQHPQTNETAVEQDKPTPPSYDEDYLEKYRPDTDEFLTFICSRLPKETNISAPISPRRESSSTIPTASGSIDLLPHSINYKPSNGCTPTNTGIHVKISNDKTSNELHNLRRSASPCKSLASNSSPNHLNSPSNRRRPIRHSPRLASTSKKISEIDSLNHNTAYDSQITYEEEMNRASMALKDIAQEINGTDEFESSHQDSSKSVNGNTTAVTAQSETKSPFKNNKHLVRGLLTREFAGAFADEEIIFESIKNHKL